MNKNIFWTTAATGGLILGLMLFAVSYVSYHFRLLPDHSLLVSAVQMLCIGAVIYVMGRRLASAAGDAGFAYSRAMGFSIAMMLFTGVIFGVGEYILQVMVDPEYFRQLFEESLRKASTDPETFEKYMEMREQAEKSIQNPVSMVIAGIISMFLYGGLVGIVVSVFLKRPPKPEVIDF